MKWSNQYIFGGALTMVVVTGLIFSHHSPVCPDDYPIADEATSALNSWTNSFYDAHPGATLKDWAEARHAFWVENHCVAALQRYDEAKSGNADPKAMEAINAGIESATQ